MKAGSARKKHYHLIQFQMNADVMPTRGFCFLVSIQDQKTKEAALFFDAHVLERAF